MTKNEVTLSSSTPAYRDFASGNFSPVAGKTAAGPGPDPPFPVKLHYVLGEAQKDSLDHIVSWQPHGRCFLVHDSKQFAERVLPNYFRQTKFSSFRRQLNLYGFKRLTTGQDKNGYYHEMFLRGMPELAHHVLRTTVKNKGPRKAASPGSEPDLYAFSCLPDPCTGPENPPNLENHATRRPTASVPEVVEVPTSTSSTARLEDFGLSYPNLRILALGLANPAQINASLSGQSTLTSTLLDSLTLSTYLATSLTTKQGSNCYPLSLATSSKKTNTSG